MSSTLHIEKFIVEVQYKGNRKKFEDLFKSRHVKTCKAQSVEHHKIEHKLDPDVLKSLLRDGFMI